MYNNFFRPVFIGLIVGAACFFLPFVALFALKIIFFFFIAGMLIRLFIFRKMRRAFWFWQSPRFAEKIRKMSDEEFDRFKKRAYRPSYNYNHRPEGPVVNIEIK